MVHHHFWLAVVAVVLFLLGAGIEILVPGSGHWVTVLLLLGLAFFAGSTVGPTP